MGFVLSSSASFSPTFSRCVRVSVCFSVSVSLFLCLFFFFSLCVCLCVCLSLCSLSNPIVPSHIFIWFFIFVEVIIKIDILNIFFWILVVFIPKDSCVMASFDYKFVDFSLPSFLFFFPLLIYLLTLHPNQRSPYPFLPVLSLKVLPSPLLPPLEKGKPTLGTTLPWDI